MSSSSNKLIIKNLSKTFTASRLKVLDNISLTVAAGEFVSIIGPSGCGKSTLLDCIAGLTDFEGDLQISGNAAYMFQDDMMFPWRNVLDNVILPLEISGIKQEKARQEAQKLLFTFGLEKFASYYPFQLSGGMRERASLLRTYLNKKEVLLLDEPFSKLDAINRQKMQQWFLNLLQKQQKSILFITHDVDEAIYLSDRIYVFSQRPGKIIGTFTINIKKTKLTETTTTKEYIAIKRKIMHVLNRA